MPFFQEYCFFQECPFSEVQCFFQEWVVFRNALLSKSSVALFRDSGREDWADSGRFDREILDRLLSLAEYCVLRVEEMFTSSSVLGV